MEDISIESIVDSAFESGTQNAAPTEEQPSGFIGLEDEQPQTQSEWQIAEGLDPTQVVATYGDKQLTAAELKDYVMRHADYTRKTQELAEQRKAYESDLQFVDANRDYISRLQSEDVEERRSVLTEIAKNFGVDLNPRPRDEQGRFTQAQGVQDGLIDPESWDDSAKPLVNAVNAANQQNASLMNEVQSLKETLNSLMEGVTTAQQHIQLTQEAEAIAAQWKAGGLENVDIQSALAYAQRGLPMKDAMFLANRNAILQHNARVAQSGKRTVPNEPGGTQMTPGVNGAGMPLERFAEATIR